MDLDLRRLMEGADGPGVPTRGGGTRWYVANTEGLDIFRLSPGDVRLDQANVHSGPHVYVSRVGTCFPLKGNTAPWPAVRMSEAQFLDHVALETLDDAVGLWEPTAMAATAFPERTAPRSQTPRQGTRRPPIGARLGRPLREIARGHAARGVGACVETRSAARARCLVRRHRLGSHWNREGLDSLLRTRFRARG